MNNGNGGPPGIQPWTKQYQNMTGILLRLLASPEHFLSKKEIKCSSYYREELVDLGILILHDNGIELVPRMLAFHSVVVDDQMYDNLRDINWTREQRKKLGLIKGRVKDEEFRRKQQERRKARRAHAKIQKAKRLAQPSEEMPLSSIVFAEDSEVPTG